MSVVLRKRDASARLLLLSILLLLRNLSPLLFIKRKPSIVTFSDFLLRLSHASYSSIFESIFDIIIICTLVLVLRAPTIISKSEYPFIIFYFRVRLLKFRFLTEVILWNEPESLARLFLHTWVILIIVISVEPTYLVPLALVISLSADHFLLILAPDIRPTLIIMIITFIVIVVLLYLFDFFIQAVDHGITLEFNFLWLPIVLRWYALWTFDIIVGRVSFLSWILIISRFKEDLLLWFILATQRYMCASSCFLLFHLSIWLLIL